MSTQLTDPIFAAIQTHRAAWAHLEDSPWKSNVHTTPEDEPRRNNVVSDAEDDLSATEPTTIAGAVALLRYVAAHRERNGDDIFAADALPTLADALERMA
jgi:hypothetical protein